MTAETIFSLCSMAVLPGWALLILLPRWKWTLGLISAGLIPFVLGLVYVGIFLSQGFGGEEGGGFGSVEAVSILFSNPYSLTAGWIHYLAFDLFVGCWEVRDSQEKGIPHWLVIPCLLLTFLLGPTGLALYFVIRTIRTRDTTIYSPA
ncbi:MAG: DUF4281 domain-containing protein [Gammaproteobacteria bacterium]|nr:DUF4281 domain-containing protein [Gammaproteobacteria bacterium]